MIKNAILVCHRCDTEFDTYGNTIVEDSEAKKIFKAQEDAAPTFGLHDLIQSGMRSRNQHIWLWMVLVLLVLSAVGLSLRWEHWQLQSSIRGYSLQTHQSALILDRDWHISPNSVSTQWLKREDKSIVLLIEGQVENMVNTALPLPEIQMIFVSQMGQKTEKIEVITEPANIPTMQAVPFASPPIDTLPVSGLNKRSFMLLIEDVPDSSAHILLHAKATQRPSIKSLNIESPSNPGQ
ncbi:MAG: hypothetical protein R8M45_02550 [Ghiorsea sp.]